jgi:hypothetical protein
MVEHHQAVEDARSAVATLERPIEQARTAVDWSQRRVRKAAAALLASSPARLKQAVARLERAEAELIDAGNEVLWLIRESIIPVRRPPPGGTDTNEGLARVAATLTRRLEIAPLSWLDLIKERVPSPAVRNWEAALAALQSDADVAIPE